MNDTVARHARQVSHGCAEPQRRRISLPRVSRSCAGAPMARQEFTRTPRSRLATAALWLCVSA